MNRSGLSQLTKKFVSLALALFLVFGVIPATIIRPLEAKADNGEIVVDLKNYGSSGGPKIPSGISGASNSSKIRVVNTGASPKIFNGNNAHGIYVENGFQGTLILDNLTIYTDQTSSGPTNSAPIMVDGSRDIFNKYESITTNVLIRLEGNNVLHAGYNGQTYAAGLEVMKGAQITIEGPGSLTAKCTPSGSSGNGGGAGIGAGNRPKSGGHMVIRSGTINAYAGYHGAGIGDGWGEHSDGSNPPDFWNGTLIIYGDAVVRSHGGYHGAGIGGACRSGEADGKDGRGIVLVFPPADVETYSANSNRATLGGVKDQVYLGDMSMIDQLPITVKTDPKAPAGKTVNLDLSQNNNVTGAINALVPMDINNTENNLYPKYIYLGTTDANGEVKTAGAVLNKFIVYTDATTENGYPYVREESDPLPKTMAPNDPKRIITLHAPAPEYEFEAQNGATLFTGYSAAHAAANPAKVTLKNLGNVPITKLNYVIESEEDAYALPRVHEVTVNPPIGKDQTYVLDIPLKTGLAPGIYKAGVGVNVPDVDVSKLPPAVMIATEVMDRVLDAHIVEPANPSVNDAPFTVTVKFTYGADITDSSKIKITNGTLHSEPIADPSTAEGIGYKEWTFEVLPDSGLSTNSVIGVKVLEGAATDEYSKLNTPSNTVYYNYSQAEPTAKFSFKNDQIFIKEQDNVKAIIDARGSGTDAKKVYIGSTEITPATASSVIAPHIRIKELDSGNIVTANFEVTDKGNEIIISPTGKFTEGKYEITVNDGNTGFNNNINNSLKKTVGVFEVRIPTLVPEDKPVPGGGTASATIHVDPTEVEYQGHKDAVVTMYGKNLQHATEGMLEVGIPAELGGGKKNAVAAADGKSASITIDLPKNEADTPKDYVFKGYLDGVDIVDTATARVKAASTNWTGAGFGLFVSPENTSYKGETATLKIKGENLHNVTDMKVVITSDKGHSAEVPFSTTESGVVELEDSSFVIPHNSLDSLVQWTYTLYGNGAPISGVAPAATQQGKATPGVDNFTVSDNFTTGFAKEIILEETGGELYFELEGLNLHNFRPLSIVEQGTGTTVVSDGDIRLFNDDNTNGESVQSAAVSIPANKTQDDITYIYELMTNAGTASGHTVKVTVKKPQSNVITLAGDKLFHGAAGGATKFTLTGKHMDVGVLELRDDERGAVYPVTQFFSNGQEAELTHNFSAHDPNQLRNDEYIFKAYFDGVYTGLEVKVEVGPSTPSVTGAKATPNFFPSVKDTLDGKGKSKIIIEGNYLENFSSVELYDPLYNKTYTVNIAGCDREAYYTVTVPSANGAYEYHVIADGVDTGYKAYIGVGVSLGMSGEITGETGPVTEDTRKNRGVWTGAGGGAKGGGFTSGLTKGFDIIEYQSERSSKADPKNPTVTITNAEFISQEQLDLAASGARVGREKSEKVGKGPLRLQLDTTSPTNSKVLEGRIYLNVDKPISGGIKPGVYTREDKIKETKAKFEERFDNKNLWFINLAENNSYGTEVEIAVFIEGIKTRDNTLKLYIYRYDRETGKYEPLKDTDYYFDTAGYLHFNTKVGGDIVISDQPLAIGGTMKETGTFTVTKPKQTDK